MYIAFKWLLSLVTLMWVAMCSIDYCFRPTNHFRSSETKQSYINIKNGSSPSKMTFDPNKSILMEQHSSTPVFYHYLMFFAGAVIVSLYNKKHDIILYLRKIYQLNNSTFEFSRAKLHLKKMARFVCVTLANDIVLIWKRTKDIFIKLTTKILKNKFNQNFDKPNLILLKRFIELKEERKNLGKLLLATIQENKNIRTRFQLENMAKNRLARYIEHTQKLIKENRCRYVSFQQLYLATHQENVFLKTRIQKLITEKDNAERNLVALINEICQSKNRDLKAFCSKFIVETKHNLLNSDVRNEIRQFLNNTKRKKSVDTLKCTNVDDAKVSEIIEKECIVISDAPSLRGLPGECVWTVKDKDGLIKKLYEYNFQSDFDNGDTIRRIRQYSVYYDKDCLLDFASSASSMNQATIIDGKSSNIKHISYPITSNRFLTESQAFQRFLRHNENILQCPVQRSSVMPCG